MSSSWSEQKRIQQMWHILASAGQTNDAEAEGVNFRLSSREWVDGFLGHEAIPEKTVLEECISEGFVTIGEDSNVRLTAAGMCQLQELRQRL